jgi:hypothetical protein
MKFINALLLVIFGSWLNVCFAQGLILKSIHNGPYRDSGINTSGYNAILLGNDYHVTSFDNYKHLHFTQHYGSDKFKPNPNNNNLFLDSIPTSALGFNASKLGIMQYDSNLNYLMGFASDVEKKSENLVASVITSNGDKYVIAKIHKDTINDIDITANTYTVTTSIAPFTYKLIKYSKQGTLLWHRQLANASGDSVIFSNLILEPTSNQIFVCGYNCNRIPISLDTIVNTTQIVVSPNGKTQSFIARFGETGQIIKVKQFYNNIDFVYYSNQLSNKNAHLSIACQGNSLAVMGFYENSAIFNTLSGSDTFVANMNYGYQNFFMCKLNLNLDIEWVNNVKMTGEPTYSRHFICNINNNGDIIIGGNLLARVFGGNHPDSINYSTYSVHFTGQNNIGTTLDSAQGGFYFIKYNTNGNIINSHIMGNKTTKVTDVYINNIGDIFATGIYRYAFAYNTNTPTQLLPQYQQNAGKVFDHFLIQFDNNFNYKSHATADIKTELWYTQLGLVIMPYGILPKLAGYGNNNVYWMQAYNNNIIINSNNIYDTLYSYTISTFSNKLYYDYAITKLYYCYPQVIPITVNTCSTSYNYNGTTYTSSGVYNFNYTALGGCDSTVQLNLTFYTIDTTILQQNSTLISTNNTPNTTYQWIDCKDNLPIANATGKTYTPPASGVYALQIATPACTTTSQCMVFNALGVQSALGNSNIIVYPNPSHNGQLYITLTAHNPATRVIFYNALGQEVLSQLITGGNNTIKQALAPGVYHYQVTGLGGGSVVVE